MQLDYKTYQKIKIFLDKISCSLPNLNVLKKHAFSRESKQLINDRSQELQHLQAHIVDFCLKFESKPYVPTSRCKAITTWYYESLLHSPQNLNSFQNNIVNADSKVIEEANFIITDKNIPFELKKIVSSFTSILFDKRTIFKKVT